ncbi:MAG: DUF512 domain-containing protein [Clostridiales bacterium]|jgi:putative radical SAM enzyme (TIGR03279 family)|nr:DUF512 domain-containing protein [Clostridiales bacterium]
MENGFKENIITGVAAGSIAEELEIRAGSALLSVNGRPVRDVFDYRYLINDEYVEILIKDADGEASLYEIEKEYDEDLGLIFETGLMDAAASCRNKCLFCFIDQLPRGLRQSLYFKDDDARLSFLSGNYVTLTNMGDEEFSRIIYYHLSPVNISVHTVSPGLRASMLKNPAAGNILERIKRLADAGITMNFQAVLCKGVNDGAALDETIETLAGFWPRGRSLSVVPAGLTKFREGLYPLEPFARAECQAVIKRVTAYQDSYKKKFGSRFVFASDEFYVKGGVKIPPASEYEDFPQLENGVGMLAETDRVIRAGLRRVALKNPRRKKGRRKTKRIAVFTGVCAYNKVSGWFRRIGEKFSGGNNPGGLRFKTYPVENEFFGREITVSGLLTGRDIIAEAKRDKSPFGVYGADFALLPPNALRAGTRTLLDDLTTRDISREIDAPVYAVEEKRLISFLREQQDYR